MLRLRQRRNRKRPLRERRASVVQAPLDFFDGCPLPVVFVLDAGRKTVSPLLHQLQDFANRRVAFAPLGRIRIIAVLRASQPIFQVEVCDAVVMVSNELDRVAAKRGEVPRIERHLDVR